MAKKIEKTNAARLLDRAKIAYELVPYTVDEDNLAATHVAEELGEVAAELADLSILTSDNPGTEDPVQIIDEIAAAFGDNSKSYIKIPDRSDAIRCAVSILQKGDILVLAGKGQETYQILASGKIHYDEREVVAKILSEKAVENK